MAKSVSLVGPLGPGALGGMERKRIPFDLESVVSRSRAGPCFICEYLGAKVGYEHVSVAANGSAVAFLAKYPTLFGEILVAPRRHLEDVTGSFSEQEYLEVQGFIYRVAEAVRLVLSPERVYILSLGSKAANAHVHWKIAPLPQGIPLERQQYHALMHEHGVIETSPADLDEYASRVRQRVRGLGDEP